MSKFHSDWIERSQYYEQTHNEVLDCPHYRQYERPVICCLCGSTRFKSWFIEANFRETMAGKIVLSVGWFNHEDNRNLTITDEQKAAVDRLHFRKIELADEVRVGNIGGYVGESTRREVLYAHRLGKAIYWHEPFAVPADLGHIGISPTWPA